MGKPAIKLADMIKQDKPPEKVEAKAEPPAPAKEPEKVEAAAAPKEPAKQEPKTDEVADGMVRILRQGRAMERQKRELEAKQAAIAAEQEAHAKSIADAKRFEESRKKDPVTAVEELLGKETVEGTFALDLINRLAERTGDTPPTPEKLAEIAAEKAAAKVREDLDKAEAAKQEAAAKQKAEAERVAGQREKEAKQAFFVGLASELKTEVAAGKYPYLAAKPAEWDDVDGYVQAEYKKTGQPPTPEAIFKHFDGEREKDAIALVAVYNKLKATAKPAKETAAPATPTARIAADAAKDTRGRPETPPEKETQRERLERVARELNTQFAR